MMIMHSYRGINYAYNKINGYHNHARKGSYKAMGPFQLWSLIVVNHINDIPLLKILFYFTTKVAHGIVVAGPESQEVVCKPEYFNCPDGYELDLVVCGCVEIKPLPPKCPPGLADKCPWNQIFDESICACVCKYDLKGTCHGKLYFNPDKCVCECPAEAEKACGRNQVLDPKTCECVCSQPAKCNRLQKFNEESCECECRKVIIPVAPRRRRPICKNDESSDSDSGSDSDSSDSGCERSRSDSDSSSSSGGKRHYGSRSKRSDSGKHDSSDSSSGGGGRKQQPQRPIIADQCPKGAKTTRRCRCVFKRRYY